MSLINSLMRDSDRLSNNRTYVDEDAQYSVNSETQKNIEDLGEMVGTKNRGATKVFRDQKKPLNTSPSSSSSSSDSSSESDDEIFFLKKKRK